MSRSYLYQISRRRTAFAKPFVWWIREPLDLGAMRRAAAAFAGRQDFAAFSDDDPDEKSTVVVLERVELVEAGALVLVRVQGSHFLWKMVRRIVGVLAAVGRVEMTPEDAAQYLNPRDGASSKRPHRSPHRLRDCFWKRRRRRRWARPDSTGDRAGLTTLVFCLLSSVSYFTIRSPVGGATAFFRPNQATLRSRRRTEWKAGLRISLFQRASIVR